MPNPSVSRREFLRLSATVVAGAPFAWQCGADTLSSSLRANARLPIPRCASYGAAARPALAKCFDLLGGIGSLVKNKTVTVKLNLTSTDFTEGPGPPPGARRS